MSEYPADKYPLRELTGRVIGAAVEAHRELGPGFTEPIYQEAFSVELASRKVRFVPEAEVRVRYKGVDLRHRFRPDFLIEDALVVEIKAADAITSFDIAQVMNYLKATGLRLALIINFGVQRIQVRRIIR